MSITYGGVPLPIATDALSSWIEHNISPRDVYEFQRPLPVTPGGDLSIGQRPIRVGDLFWPRGASRWAVGHFLATENKLAIIRNQVYNANAPGKYQALPFVMSDGTRTLTTNLWMLPPRPLSQYPADNGIYLLTLVDVRYFWHEARANIVVDPGVTTWTGLFGAISSALGVTISTDTIAAAYLTPASGMNCRYKNVPSYLDWVASTVGQQIVRRLDGTVISQSTVNAKASVDAQLASLQNKKIAGGKFAFELTQTPNDLVAHVPRTVTVTFPEVVNDAGSGDFWAVDVNLSSLTITGLSPVTGYVGVHVLHSMVKATTTTAGGTPTNSASLTALATAWAIDWYRARLGKLDTRYAGIVNWTPDGLHDHIEWTYRVGARSTRIQKPAGNDLDTKDEQANVPDSITIYNLTVINEGDFYDLNVFNDFTTYNLEVTNNFIVNNWLTIINNYYTFLNPAQIGLVSKVCNISKYGLANGSETEINSGTLTEVATVTVTLSDATTVNVWLVIEWDGQGTATPGDVFLALLRVDGVDTAYETKYSVTHAACLLTCPQNYASVMAAGAHTFKIMAMRVSGAGSIFAGTNSTIMVTGIGIQVQESTLELPAGVNVLDVYCYLAGDNCCPDEGDDDDGFLDNPHVTEATPCIEDDETDLIIAGWKFSATAAENTLNFVSPAGTTASVTSSTTTALTINDLSLPPGATGPLLVIVTTNGLTSGNPVQVATIAAICPPETICCPDYGVPVTLYVDAVIVTTDPLVDGHGTGSIVYNPAISKWVGTITFDDAGDSMEFTLECKDIGSGEKWYYETTGRLILSNRLIEGTCDPLSLSAFIDEFAFDATFIITETAP